MISGHWVRVYSYKIKEDQSTLLVYHLFHVAYLGDDFWSLGESVLPALCTQIQHTAVTGSRGSTTESSLIIAATKFFKHSLKKKYKTL